MGINPILIRPTSNATSSASVCVAAGATGGLQSGKLADDFLLQLNVWRERGEPGEGVYEAYARVQDAWERNAVKLDLSGLRLWSLPPMPPGVEELNIEKNSISKWPESVQQFTHILGAHNHFKELPTGPFGKLALLDLNDNLLEQYPIAHPGIDILCDRNKFSRPPSLLPAQSGEDHRCPLEGLGRLHQAQVLGRGSRPAPVPARKVEPVDLNTNSPARVMDPKVIDSVVSFWYGKGDFTAVQRARWQSVDREPGAWPFINFLHRLKRLPSASAPKMRCMIEAWLIRLSDQSALRASTLAIAQDASESCDDRLMLAFNMMQNVALVDDIKTGKFDHDLPRLMKRLRCLFRLECIERISIERIERIKSGHVEGGFWARLGAWFWAPLVPPLDEIEVMLGFTEQLDKRLDLASKLTGMNYYRSSDLNDGDIEKAEARVKIEENAEFRSWIANSELVHTVFKRRDPSGYEAMRKALLLEIDPDGPIKIAVAARLDEVFLAADDADAQRNVSKALTDEKISQANMAYLNAFLVQNNMEALLDKPWPDRPQKKPGFFKLLRKYLGF